MRQTRTPELTDLAFEGRNKAYGAYYLRKKYNKYLSVSLLTGIVIIAVVVVSPFLYYYFEPVPLLDDDFLYEVEYMEMSRPPDDEMNKIARAMAKPPDVILKAPVVTDSVIPEKEKKEEEKPVENLEEKTEKTDSVNQAAGSGLGEGSGTDNSVAVYADVRPQFPGGDDNRLKYLRQNVRYPEEAIRKKIQGVVMTSFIIERDGSVSNINIVSGIGGGCDEEAIRVVRAMPRWEPAKRNGQVVRIILKMPILFRIPGTARPK